MVRLGSLVCMVYQWIRNVQNPTRIKKNSWSLILVDRVKRKQSRSVSKCKFTFILGHRLTIHINHLFMQCQDFFLQPSPAMCTFYNCVWSGYKIPPSS